MTSFTAGSTLNAISSAFYNQINHFHPPPDESPTAIKERLLRELAKVAVMSAAWNAPKRRNLPKCHPDTRRASQESLAAWPDNPTVGPVRWINGWPGTGKSTLSQTMAEHWASQGRLAASFFFSPSETTMSAKGIAAAAASLAFSSSRSKDDACTTAGFNETIAYQLLQSLSFPPNALSLLTPDQLSMNGWTSIVRALQLVSLASPMVVIIDGLDEVTREDEQIKLLHDVLQLASQPQCPLRFLISCRPQRHLEEVFYKVDLGGHSYRILLGVSTEDNDDIRTFLRDSLNRLCQDRRRDNAMSITHGPWPDDNQVEKLVDRACGQFVFASTVVAFVGDEGQDPVELLNLVLERRASTFTSIDALYLIILQRIERKLQHAHLHQTMHSLLWHIWVFSRVPAACTPSFIADFWSEDVVTINILVRHLQPLLHQPQGPHSSIQFRHQTFRDFFLSRPSFSRQKTPFIFSVTHSMFKFWLIFMLAPSSCGQCLQRSSGFIVKFQPYREPLWKLKYTYIRKGSELQSCRCYPQLETIYADDSTPEHGSLARLFCSVAGIAHMLNGNIKFVEPCGDVNCIFNSPTSFQTIFQWRWLRDTLAFQTLLLTFFDMFHPALLLEKAVMVIVPVFRLFNSSHHFGRGFVALVSLLFGFLYVLFFLFSVWTHRWVVVGLLVFAYYVCVGYLMLHMLLQVSGHPKLFVQLLGSADRLA